MTLNRSVLQKTITFLESVPYKTNPLSSRDFNFNPLSPRDFNFNGGQELVLRTSNVSRPRVWTTVTN